MSKRQQPNISQNQQLFLTDSSGKVLAMGGQQLQREEQPKPVFLPVPWQQLLSRMLLSLLAGSLITHAVAMAPISQQHKSNTYAGLAGISIIVLGIRLLAKADERENWSYAGALSFGIVWGIPL